jgi:hypothetical protein
MQKGHFPPLDDSSHGRKLFAHARLVCFLLSLTFLLVICCCDDDASGFSHLEKQFSTKNHENMIHGEARPMESQLFGQLKVHQQKFMTVESRVMTASNGSLGEIKFILY